MLTIFENRETLSRAAAEIFVEEANWAVKTRGRFSVVLAGGRTPLRMYNLLCAAPLRDRVPWSKTHIFWSDERCVPPHDSRNNAALVRAALLDHVPVPRAQVYPIVCAPESAEAAQRYEKLLQRYLDGDSLPGPDMVLLGMDAEGQTASLFQNSDALRWNGRWVVPVGNPHEPFMHITMTPAFINRCGLIVFLLSGKDKAQPLQKVLQGPAQGDQLPARMIHPDTGRLLWLVDQDAASRLRPVARTQA